MNTRIRQASCLALYSSAFFILSVPAAARAANGVDEPRNADDPRDREGRATKDGDVIVTGVHEKSFRNDVAQVGFYRNQTLVETPMTVTVINRALLDAQNAQGLEDALRNVAGVTQQGNSPLTANSYVPRGVAANARTNFRLNGTLPIINYQQSPIENKESAEALKGVSALYYGFTTPSIIVDLVTKRAGSSPVTAVKLDSDVDGSYGVALDIGRAMGPDNIVGVRLNGYAGHQETPVNGIHGYRWLTSGAFDVRPTDRLSLQLDVEHYERKSGEPGSVLLPNAIGAVKGVGGTITLPPIPDPHNAYAPTDATYYARTTMFWAGSTTRSRAPGPLTSMSGSRDSPRTPVGRYRQHQSGDRGKYVDGHAESDRGLWEYRRPVRGQRHRQDRVRPTRVLLGYSLNHLSEVQQPGTTFATTQNLYKPYQVRLANLVLVPRGGTTSYQYTHDSGFYGLDMAHLGDRLIVIAGVRQERFSLNKVGNAPFKLTTFTPTAGVVFHPVPRVSLYSTYVEGLESAGTAPLGTTNVGDTLPPWSAVRPRRG